MLHFDSAPADRTEPATDEAPASPAAALDTPTPSPIEAPETSPFAGVPEVLRRAVERRGFEQLTEVQSAVLASGAGSRDLKISSQTGSGKTVALGFALCADLVEAVSTRAGSSGRVGPASLAIVPTRELAQQVAGELGWLFADVRGLRVQAVTGGTDVARERRQLQRSPVIVVGTPGRVLDHVRSGALDCGAVSQLVLDEADQMLDMGFRDDLEAILAAVPAERRTHLVSATFPDGVRALTARYQRDPVHVEGTRLGTAHVDIDHVAHIIDRRNRYAALVNLLLLAERRRTLVFVATRADAARFADRLLEDGFSVSCLSGDMAQAQRTRTLAAFRAGAVSTLVATDVAARGLDVEDVHTVVHVDPPMDSDGYTHRSGRTGRAGRKGRSVVLVPRSGQRRVRRLLGGAGVNATWAHVPTADEVRSALAERSAERVRAALEDGRTGNKSQRAEALRLLEDRDPADVVACLLARDVARLPRQPFDVEPVLPDRDRASPRKGGPAHERSRAASRPWQRDGFVRFSINWGARDGATPRRVLAHICRRGDVPGRLIGAIDVQPHATTFEVQGHAAGSFASRARTRDRHEPHLVIRMEQGGPGSMHGGQRHGRAPRGEVFGKNLRNESFSRSGGYFGAHRGARSQRPLRRASGD